MLHNKGLLTINTPLEKNSKPENVSDIHSPDSTTVKNKSAATIKKTSKKSSASKAPSMAAALNKPTQSKKTKIDKESQSMLIKEEKIELDDSKKSASNNKKKPKTNKKELSKAGKDKTSKANDDKRSKLDEKKVTKADEDKTSKLDEKKATKADEDKSSKLDEKKASKADEDKSSKLDEKKASKTDEDKTSELDEKKASKADEDKSSKLDEKKASKAGKSKALELDQDKNSLQINKENSTPSKKSPTRLTLQGQPHIAKLEQSVRRTIRITWLTTSKITKATWFIFKVLVFIFYKFPVQTLLTSVLLVILFFISSSASKLENNMVLSQISENTVNKISGASDFTRHYNTDKVDKRGEREMLNAGAPKWVQQPSIRAILFYARKAGLSIDHQAVLLSIAEVESGFNPMARAPTTSACGLFQFVKATGKRYHLERQSCLDPWRNAEAGIQHYIKNYEKRVKLKVEDLKGSERVFKTFELGYHLHHDGPDSAVPSDNVRIMVQRGTPFLLQVYEILESEYKSEQQLPGVFGYLYVNIRNLYEIIVEYFE